MTIEQYVSGLVVGAAFIAVIVGIAIYERRQGNAVPWFLVAYFAGIGLLVIGGVLLTGVA